MPSCCTSCFDEEFIREYIRENSSETGELAVRYFRVRGILRN